MPKSSASYTVLDDEQVEYIASLSKEEQDRYLVLDEHPDFEGQWIVNGFDPGFFFDFEGILGPYRVVSPATLMEFLALARDLGYHVAFGESPERILDAYAHLNEPPPFSLNSHMEGTINGFLPWQVQGFNYLKDLSGGKAIWSTGTGKTALAAALIRYHNESSNVNLTFYLAKAHNKINTQRKLKKLADVDSIVLDHSAAKSLGLKFTAETTEADKRAAVYVELYRKLQAGEKLVLITNYEKFREDEIALKILCEDNDTLFIWDEMPTRLSNRDTQLYHSVLRCIWKTSKDTDTSVPNPLKSKFRVKSYRGYELTATPIENDPEGDFNCTRLLDPSVFGTAEGFKAEFAATYNYFNPNKVDSWHKLDKMSLKQAHITHIVNKKDPDVAKFFPKTLPEVVYIDWNPKHRKVYDTLTGKATKLLEINFDSQQNILALIGVMQMMCDAPSMINESAKNRAQYEMLLSAYIEDEDGEEPDPHGSGVALDLILALGKELADDGHTKHEALREILLDKHAGEKGLVYTSFGPMLLPILSRKLDEWGVKHVVYAGTPKQRQDAQDRFRTDDSVRVFLSSDAGADSIDMEMAQFGVDFDLPWKYTTRIQRWNRANRAGAKWDMQYFYSLCMANSIEDRKLEIIETKQGYHEAVYEGIVNEAALSSRMTRDDLYYILTGQ